VDTLLVLSEVMTLALKNPASSRGALLHRALPLNGILVPVSQGHKGSVCLASAPTSAGTPPPSELYPEVLGPVVQLKWRYLTSRWSNPAEQAEHLVGRDSKRQSPQKDTNF
jgi:hypothetical protein